MSKFTDTYFEAQQYFLDKFPDLSDIKDPEVAAKKAHEYVRKMAKMMGMSPDIETFIAEPGTRSEAGDAWWVVWESGPHDWAIAVTLDGKDRTYAKNWYCETYWGFDLIFVEI